MSNCNCNCMTSMCSVLGCGRQNLSYCYLQTLGFPGAFLCNKCYRHKGWCICDKSPVKLENSSDENIKIENLRLDLESSVVNVHKRIDYLEDQVKRLTDSISDLRIELSRKKDAR